MQPPDITYWNFFMSVSKLWGTGLQCECSVRLLLIFGTSYLSSSLPKRKDWAQHRRKWGVTIIPFPFGWGRLRFLQLYAAIWSCTKTRRQMSALLWYGCRHDSKRVHSASINRADNCGSRQKVRKTSCTVFHLKEHQRAITHSPPKTQWHLHGVQVFKRTWWCDAYNFCLLFLYPTTTTTTLAR